MSNNFTATVTEDLIERYVVAFIEDCCNVACLALYVYDFCINIRREIDFIWQKNLSIAAALFVLLHFSTFWLFALCVAIIWVENCESGYDLNIEYAVSVLLLQLVVITIGTLRVYAINGRKWLPPASIFVLQMPAIVANIYVCATLSWWVETALGSSWCTILVTDDQLYTKLVIADIVTSWVANALILTFTWRSTYGIRALANANGMRLSLTSVLLRDGTIYFGTILLLNSLSLVAYLAGQSLTGLKAFSNVFLTITLSRMLLNLRDASLTHDGTTGSSSQMSDIRFSRGMASLSGSIANEWDRDDGLAEEYDDGPGVGNSDPEDVQDVGGMHSVHDTSEAVNIGHEGSAASCH